MAAIAIVAYATTLFAEDHLHTTHESHPMNEIGISGGCTYAISHDEFAPVIYADFFRKFTHSSKWAYGAASEYVFSQHTPHLVVGLGVRFAPTHKLHIAVLPGISVDFPKSHGEVEHQIAAHESTAHTTNNSNVNFAVQSDICYEVLSYKNFHLAPTLGYSYSISQGSHITLGVHFTFGFN